jgi:hypothetical protein
MKKIILIFALAFTCFGFAQEHFSGISTSRRIGILNGAINPAEFSNLSSRLEIGLFATSINASNNKVGFSDLLNSNNLNDLIFTGSDPVNMRIDAEIQGLGVAFKIQKWSFALFSKATAKLNLVGIDPNIGSAISNGFLSNPLSITTLNNTSNQRLLGTTWGEVNLSVARNVFENENNKWNVGATIKLLFPGSYTNLGANIVQGTLTNYPDGIYLNDASANINIAYSGNLANNFDNVNDYSKSLFGNLNGLATDFGINYQRKSSNGYKLNAGASIRNIGSMTFKGTGNSSTNYVLTIPQSPNLGLNLSDFEGDANLQDVENTLLDSGFLNKTERNNESISVKLPTVFNAYADIKVVSKFYVSIFGQKKLGSDNDNNQITSQDSFSLTPRLAFKNFELYSSWASNEISGITGGIGTRLFGFYMGSSSILTALTSDTKQADIYFGYRFGIF